MSDPLGPGRGRLVASAGFSRIRCFVLDTKGGIAISWALASVVLVMFLGALIDYSRLANAKTEYQIACDRAILAAMREVQADQEAGRVTDMSALPGIATRSFENNLRDRNKGYGAVFSSTYTENDAQTKVTGRGTFSAPVPLGVGAIVGGSSAIVGGECEIVVGEAVKMDMHFLLDTSASMGLAADPADRTRMKNGTKADVRISNQDAGQYWPGAARAGCAFACHYKRENMFGVLPLFPVGHMSTLDWARANEIKLRIDVEREGVTSVINSFLANAAWDRRISLSAFNERYSKIEDPTNDKSALLSAMSNVTMGSPNLASPSIYDVPTLPEGSMGFEAFKTDLTAYMAGDGDGRRQVIILVTDGVHSSAFAPLADHYQFPASYCDILKSTGADVGVIYTTYLSDPGEVQFDGKVSSYYSDIEPALRQCATRPEFFVVGDSSAQILSAFSTLQDRVSHALALSR